MAYCLPIIHYEIAYFSTFSCYVILFQLEKMQAENAQEWTMREKLSSEKSVLERENKRMRNEITRLEDELRERNRPPAAVAVDVDVKILQDELACKTKVFCIADVGFL